MKKKLMGLILCLILMLSLIGCGTTVDQETANKYISQAEIVVSQLLAADYEALTEQFDEQMKQALPIDTLEQIEPTIEAAGAFVKIKNSVVQLKDGYYVTILHVECKDDNLILTISFNSESQIAGLFIK